MLQPAKPSQPVYPIPIDIYRIIISQLSPAELAACLRVSRLTHTLALTKLYRKITIDLDEEVNPLFNRSSKKGLGGKHKARYSGSRGKGEGSGLKGVLGGIIGSKRIHSASSTAPRSPPQEPLPNRFSYTTDLTITSHSQPLCTDFPPLIMPQLHTLRITPTFQENHLNICHCRHHPAYHKATDPCSCPLLRELRPRRVILGSDVTGLSGSAEGLWPPFPPVWVKEVVVYLGSCTGIEIGPEATTSLVDKFPNTVEKLVLVFRPRHWPFHNGGRWQFRRVAGIEGALDPLLLWRAIGKACSGNAKRIEVAGLETVDRDWTELPIKVEQEAIRREMRKALQLKGAKSEDVEKSLGALVFKGRASYSED